MVIVFVGITFLVKSVIFISLALSRKKTLLHYDNHSSQTLLMEFISLSVDGGGTMWIDYIIMYPSLLFISTIHLYYPSLLSIFYYPSLLSIFYYSSLLFISTIHLYYSYLLFISTIHLYFYHYPSTYPSLLFISTNLC